MLRNLLYTIIFFLLILATSTETPSINLTLSNGLSVLYLTRNRWIHLVPVADYIYSRFPSTFAHDIEEGFSSNAFDLSANVATGDTRSGLDDTSKWEIRKIMRSRRVGFDEARRIFTEQRFAKNNIGPDGRPTDPKFVSFS